MQSFCEISKFTLVQVVSGLHLSNPISHVHGKPGGEMTKLNDVMAHFGAHHPGLRSQNDDTIAVAMMRTQSSQTWLMIVP